MSVGFHCSGLSCCGAWAQGCLGFGSHNTWAQQMPWHGHGQLPQGGGPSDQQWNWYPCTASVDLPGMPKGQSFLAEEQTRVKTLLVKNINESGYFQSQWRVTTTFNFGTDVCSGIGLKNQT